MFRHPLPLLAGIATVAAGASLFLHSSAAPAPGGTFSWVPAAPAASAPAVLAGPVPAGASASPAPSPDGGIWGGLTMPLTTLLQHLNGETQSSAAGQYTILQALENGLRDRIDDFLNWVTSRR